MSFRSLILLALLSAAAFLVSLGACSDRDGPTGPAPSTPSFSQEDNDDDEVEEEDAEERIEDLIKALFPEPEEEQADDLFEEIEDLVGDGEFAAARDLTFQLVDLTLNTDLLEPEDLTKEEAEAELLDLLLDFVGVDGGAQMVGPAGAQFVTQQADAAVDIPPGAVDDDIVVVIMRINVNDPEDCLPTNRPQREGCYEFATDPPMTFNLDVRVEICFDTSGLTEEQEDLARLYQFDPGDPNVRALPNRPTSLVDCTGFVANAPTKPLGRLAKAAWAGFQRVVGSLVSPPPLYAADQGLGGLTRSFSRIGWGGSSLLVYGPSLTPLVAGFRTENEETLAADEGHFVTVVDGPTWAGLAAGGPGGFGDYDALVFGDGTGSIANAVSNSAAWGGVVTGRVVVSAVHSGIHQCDLTLVACQNVNAEQFHNPEARTFIRQAINWAALGTTTGAYVALDFRASGAGDPPGVSIGFLDGIGNFEAIGPDPNITFLSKEDSVEVTNPGHPIVAGLDGDDFSGWFASYHQLFNSVPAAFSTVAEGFRRVDPSVPANPLTNFPVIVVRP